MEPIGHYIARFEELEQTRPLPASLARVRRVALARFAELGFPGSKDEEWRATGVAPIAEVPFAPRAASPLDLSDLARLVPGPVLEMPGPRRVFVNGVLSQGLGSRDLPEGLELVTLDEALQTHPALVEVLLARGERKSFSALNMAFFGDGALLIVREGAVLPEPVHLVYVTSGVDGPTMAAPRTVALLGAGSRAALVESYVGGGERTLTNAVTEIRLGDGAVLHHHRIEHEAAKAFHVGTTSVEQGKGSEYRSFAFSDGGALARHELEVALAGEGASCALDGLTLIRSGQLIDHHTFVDHASPGCRSEELYKGILDGTARGVFRGRVLVRLGAQKTDARQANRNLLLSRKAQVNAKPQLEIHADDVKCTHGATVGQLDREALFYLRARGIGEPQARALLTEAFAGEVTERLSLGPVRESVGAALRAWLAGREEVARA